MLWIMRGKRRFGALLIAVTAVTACTSSSPATTKWPATKLVAIPAATTQHIFGPNTGDTGNCSDVLTSMAVGTDGTIYVSEDTCQLSAGFEGPGRPHRTSHRPPHLLNALHPDGSVTQLPAVVRAQDATPVRVLTSLAGALIGYGGQHQLLALRSGQWESFSAAQPNGRPAHSGDGGAIGLAAVADARAAAVDAAGNLYVAEPFAVRRVSTAGVVTTIAGTNRDDPPRSFYWGGRGSAGQDFPGYRGTSQPQPATRTPMPFIAAMTVSADGTVWIINLGTIYRIRQGTFERVVALPSGRRAATGKDVPAYSSPYGLAARPGSDHLIAYDGATKSLYDVDASAGVLTTVTRLPFGVSSASGAQPVATAAHDTVLVCLGSRGLAAIKG